MKEKKLTPKQEAFATALATGLSQSAAYRQAYPRAVQWRDAAVHPEASRLAAHPMVAARVAELGRLAAAANEVTVERIVKELAKIAFGNARSVMSWDNGHLKLIPSVELSEDQSAIVAEVKESSSQAGGALSLKTHDKLSALKMLGEHLAMFTKKAELSGPGGTPLVSPASGVLVVPATMDTQDWAKAAAELDARQQTLARQQRKG